MAKPTSPFVDLLLKKEYDLAQIIFLHQPPQLVSNKANLGITEDGLFYVDGISGHPMATKEDNAPMNFNVRMSCYIAEIVGVVLFREQRIQSQPPIIMPLAPVRD